MNKNQFLHFAFQGTRDNQLFLTNAISQKVDTFRPIYNWFKENLTLIASDLRFGSVEDFFNEGQLFSTFNELLSQLDTGISGLEGEEISFNKLSGRVKDFFQKLVKEGENITLPAILLELPDRMEADLFGEYIIVTRIFTGDQEMD